MGGGEGVLEPLTDDFLLDQDSSSGVFKQRHWGKRSRASGRGQQSARLATPWLFRCCQRRWVGCNAELYCTMYEYSYCTKKWMGKRLMMRSAKNFDYLY